MTVVQHESALEAKSHFERKLQNITKHSRWMGVLFYIEDGKIKMDRTSWDFPSGDFLKTIQMFKEGLERELGLGEEIQPLPLAPHLKGGNNGNS